MDLWVESAFVNTNSDLVKDVSPQLGNLDVNAKNINFGDSASSSDDRLNFNRWNRLIYLP